jgi:hypothetical protein
MSSARSRRFAAIASLASLVAIGLAEAALAQASGADKARADVLFKKGRELLASDVGAACAAFAESQTLDPRVSTLINLADCHVKQGKPATALGEYNEALAQARRANQPARVSYVETQIAALKVPRITVEVTKPAPSIAVTLDGAALGSASWATPFPIDPGKHVVAASAPEREAWRSEIEVASDGVRVVVPELALSPTPPSNPQPKAEPRPTEPRVEGDAAVYAQRGGGVALIGIGAASIVTGAIFGIATLKTHSDAKRECPDTVCPTQSSLDLHNRAATFAKVSNATIATGLVLAAGGTALVLTAPLRGNKGGDRISAFLSPNPVGATMGVRTRW